MIDSSKLIVLAAHSLREATHMGFGLSKLHICVYTHAHAQTQTQTYLTTIHTCVVLLEVKNDGMLFLSLLLNNGQCIDLGFHRRDFQLITERRTKFDGSTR